MSTPNTKGQRRTTNIDLNSDIGSQLVVHKNLSQEIIIVNIDRMKLILQDHHAKLKRNTDWINPLAIFIALLLADLTATFNTDFIGIKAAVWEAIFILLTIIAALYLTVSLINLCRKGSSIEDVINHLKEHSRNNSDALDSE